MTSETHRRQRRGVSGAVAGWLAALFSLVSTAAGSAAAGADRNVFTARSPHATGVMEITALEIIPVQRDTSEQELDAVLPSHEKLTWGQEPLEVQSSRREQICLNGIWQFVPMLDARETRPPGGLAYIRVPGSWRSGLASERGRGPAWQRSGHRDG